jgi:hypothetical protein
MINGVAESSETSLHLHQTGWRHVPEESKLNNYCCGVLNTHMVKLFYLPNIKGCHKRGSAASRLLELRVRIPPEALKYLPLLSVLCCHVAVSASGWSLVQRSTTKCGVSECDREASIMRRPWPTTGCCTMEYQGLSRVSETKQTLLT